MIDIDHLGRYDSLYVSSHACDAPLSCAGRLVADRKQGHRTLLVTVFDEGSTAAAAGLDADHLALGLRGASRRDAHYASVCARAFGRHASDEACVNEVAHLLQDVGHRTKARHVYLPMGVGGDVDRRLVHEAGVATFPVVPAQDIFLYEERPWSLVPGAVRVRLGQMGARLPPAVTDVGDRGNLLRFLRRVQRAPFVRSDLRGFVDRLRFTRLAARYWREARGWQPRKAFGPRLQPVIHAIEGDADAARELVRGVEAAARRLIGSARELEAEATGYARRLGRSDLIERYWLLLPALDRDGVTPMPAEPGVAVPPGA